MSGLRGGGTLIKRGGAGGDGANLECGGGERIFGFEGEEGGCLGEGGDFLGGALGLLLVVLSLELRRTST